MKMLPKSFAEFTPVTIISNVNYVLVDDDELIANIWNLSAKMAGKNIKTFQNVSDFMMAFPLYEKNTMFYIDASLGGDIKGEDVAKILYDQGYHNLFITTGYPKENFSHVHWVKN